MREPMSKTLIASCLLWVGLNAPLNTSAQNEVSSPQNTPLFEVISVRENYGHSGPGAISLKWTPDSYTAENAPLARLIGPAYGVRPDTIVGGPGWLHERTFDINAKIAPADVDTFSRLSFRQKDAMLQQILTSRFLLKAHSEKRIGPIYQLVIAKGASEKGRKLQPSTETPAELATKQDLSVTNEEIRATDIPMAQLVKVLWGILGRPVVDGTDMGGSFSYDLKWTPEYEIFAGDDQGPNPSIFTAIREQLGLELRPAKGPVDTLVVDSVTLPTTN